MTFTVSKLFEGVHGIAELKKVLGKMKMDELRELAASEDITLAPHIRKKAELVEKIADVLFSRKLNDCPAYEVQVVEHDEGVEPDECVEPEILPAKPERKKLLPLPVWDIAGAVRENAFAVMNCDTEKEMRELLWTADRLEMLSRMCDFLGAKFPIFFNSYESLVEVFIDRVNELRMPETINAEYRIKDISPVVPELEATKILALPCKVEPENKPLNTLELIHNYSAYCGNIVKLWRKVNRRPVRSLPLRKRPVAPEIVATPESKPLDLSAASRKAWDLTRGLAAQLRARNSRNNRRVKFYKTYTPSVSEFNSPQQYGLEFSDYIRV